MKNNRKNSLHSKGFASTLYVLALGILLLGSIVAVLYPSQVKNKNLAKDLRKQVARNQMESDALNIAKGAISQIALGMENPNHSDLYEHTKLQNPYEGRTKGPSEEIDRVGELHKKQASSLLVSSGEPNPSNVPTTQLNTMGNPREQSLEGSTVYGPLNVSVPFYNFSSSNTWGSIRYTDNSATEFNANAARIGLPVLHPNYTYGLGSPEETATNFVLRDAGSFQSPIPPVNLNKFSGWGFYVNPRATNGFALYPPAFFPGLAVGNEPMLGRLHMYKFDRVLPIGLTTSPESLRYRVRVMLMEVPYQGALDYEGELQVNNTAFWNNSTIQGMLLSDSIQGDGKSLNTGAKVLVKDDGNADVNIGSTNVKSSDLIETGTRDLQTKKNTSVLGSTGTMVRSFLINPATFGTRANRRNWFEWPASLPHDNWFTYSGETNTAGGPSIDQYSSGVLQSDLHLRVDKISNRLRVIVYKVRSNSTVDQVAVFTNNGTTTQASVSGGYSAAIQNAVNLDNNSEIRISMSTLVDGLSNSANLAGSLTITNRQWPVRGMAVYRDPRATWTLSDPTVIITDATDMNRFHEGLSITSQFNLRISQNFNIVPVPAIANGIVRRYASDPYLPAGPHFVPMAIYAPSVGYFEAGGSQNSALTLTGSLSQRGSAPFLPPTTSGTNPIIDNRTAKISSTGAPVLDVYGGTMNGYETINITGIRHQVELPPIVPIRWLVTYMVEELQD